jgi:hypothetical protein
MELFAKYHPTNSFQPLNSEDFRKSLRLKDNDFIRIETWKERSVGFHRKYFALLKCAINHLPEDEKFEQYRDMEYLREYTLIMIGKCKVIIGLSGRENYIPKSISFQKMDEMEFTEVYDKTLNVLLKYFLNHLSKEDFENDILNFF